MEPVKAAGRLGDLLEVVNKHAHPLAAEGYNHLRVQFPSGEERHLLLTDFEIKRALKRAEKNPEDLPTVSWINDALD